MSQRIHLAAIVAKEGRLFMVRHETAGEWELPGGPFLPEHPDPEAGIDAVLRDYGIEMSAEDEDFIETLFVADGDGHMVYNLYAASSWRGEPSVAPGTGTGWFEPAELDAVQMNAQVRDAILEAYGLRERPDNTAAMMAALQQQVHETAAELTGTEPLFAPPSPSPGDEGRRAAAHDVLRTLTGNDPAEAAANLERRYGPIAGDVIGFAFGDVWSDRSLDRKTRSLQVVAMLGALGRTGPLESHVGGALNHGATPAELVQTVRMIAVYAGFPAALDAWKVVEAVLTRRGLPVPGRPL